MPSVKSEISSLNKKKKLKFQNYVTLIFTAHKRWHMFLCHLSSMVFLLPEWKALFTYVSCCQCLTWIAPMFSISWSVLEAPSSTQLTPSFLRHHARDRPKHRHSKQSAARAYNCKSVNVKAIWKLNQKSGLR